MRDSEAPCSGSSHDWPPLPRDCANLGTEAAANGMGTRAQMWNRTAWKGYPASQGHGCTAIADDIVPAVGF